MGQDGRDLIIGKRSPLWRHFKVVGLSENLHGPGQALEDDLNGAVWIACQIGAASEGRKGAAGGSLAIDSVAGGAIQRVKLRSVLGKERA